MLDRVERFFDRTGWDYERLGDQFVGTGFSTELEDGSEQPFPLFAIEFGDEYEHLSFLRLSIVPFVERLDGRFPVSFAEEVVLVNHYLPGAKMAFDDDGDLELCIDLPAGDVDDEHLERATQLLGELAALHYPSMKERSAFTA